MSVLRSRRVVVVGATGAVGREALAVLASRGVPAARARAVASARSAGAEVPYGDGAVRVDSLSRACFAGADVALFCATSGVASEWASVAVGAGCRVVDNSSAFRADADVPLVVPEINGQLVTTGTRLVANPNCSTIIMLLALEPLRRRFGVARISVATYQAVSGAGAAGMEELGAQVRASVAGEAQECRVFGEPCAFNVFSHNSAVDPVSGLNGEEAKMIAESRRIWNDDGLGVSPTCVRVPVYRAHSQAIAVELREPANEAAVREALSRAAGVRVVDDRAANRFPTPLKATGLDDVLVGRIRRDPADGSGRSWCLFVSGDQLRKGAALNAVQVAELWA
jgi:aspartate-semialdehyde dehydrogenase